MIRMLLFHVMFIWNKFSPLLNSFPPDSPNDCISSNTKSLKYLLNWQNFRWEMPWKLLNACFLSRAGVKKKKKILFAGWAEEIITVVIISNKTITFCALTVGVYLSDLFTESCLLTWLFAFDVCHGGIHVHLDCVSSAILMSSVLMSSSYSAAPGSAFHCWLIFLSLLTSIFWSRFTDPVLQVPTHVAE